MRSLLFVMVLLMLSAAPAAADHTATYQCKTHVGGSPVMLYVGVMSMYVGGCPLGATDFGGTVIGLETGSWCDVYHDHDQDGWVDGHDRIEVGDYLRGNSILYAFCGVPATLDQPTTTVVIAA